jgi:cytochrome P450
VRPAIRARGRAPAADVISHLLAEGYRPREIMTECLTYAAAGMATTREFITLAGWHLLTDDDLRAAFCAGDDLARGKMLAELLRLEPVVGTLYRRGGPADALLALDVRAINADAAGSCPHAFEAGRAAGAALSFGDGPHRCPGAEVALQESAIFLARLLAVPGLRLVSPPRMRWNAVTTGYELRDMRLACTADR